MRGGGIQNLLDGRLRLPESLVAVPEEAVPAGEKLLSGKVRFGLRCVSVNLVPIFTPYSMITAR